MSRKHILNKPGEGNMYEKMDNIREKQEKLARLHFELDAEHATTSQES